MRYEFSSDTLDWRQPSYVFDALSWRSQRQVKLRPFVTTHARCTILRDLLIKMEVKLRVEFGVSGLRPKAFGLRSALMGAPRISRLSLDFDLGGWHQ
jgi:hypothetical protein